MPTFIDKNNTTIPYNNSFSIHDDDNTIIGHEVKTVLVFKFIASIFSLLGSLFIIICYSYLTYLVKVKPKKEKNSEENNENNKNSDENNENNNTEEKNNRNKRRKSRLQKEYKNLKMGYGHDLIFYLAISDLILSIAAFVKSSDFNSGNISSVCILQGFLINFSELSSICWTTIIAISVYLSTKNNAINLIPKYYLLYFLFSIGIPLFFAIAPLFSNSYGPAGAWCWLNTKNHENTTAWIWSLVIYLFIWGNIIVNLISIIKSINYFKIRTFEIEEENIDEANFLRNFCIVLRFFPIILIICWLPATINRIYLFASRRENTFLYTIQAFFSNLTGFLNCIVYSYYYKTFIKLWCCAKKQENFNDMELSRIASDNNNNGNNSNEKRENDIEIKIENDNEIDINNHDSNYRNNKGNSEEKIIK